MTTFSPPALPAVGLSRRVDVRVLSAPFGDGYRADAGDGLNAIPRSIAVTWDALDPADAADIETFFVDHKGYLKFNWTDPRDSSPGQFICRSWRRTSPSSESDAISATFEKVFDL